MRQGFISIEPVTILQVESVKWKIESYKCIVTEIIDKI